MQAKWVSLFGWPFKANAGVNPGLEIFKKKPSSFKSGSANKNCYYSQRFSENHLSQQKKSQNHKLRNWEKDQRMQSKKSIQKFREDRLKKN